MKEDVSEQIVEHYFNSLGYFTLHNVKYHLAESDPKYDSKTDSVSSDIDILGINPCKKESARIVVINCKN